MNSLLLTAVLGASVAPAGLQGVVKAGKAPAQARAALVKDGFAVVEGSEEDFFSLYDRNAYEKVPSFISADVVLHVFHVRFDEELAATEEAVALPALKAFAAGQLARALSRWPDGGAPDARAKALALYHATALRLLDEGAPLDPRVAAQAAADAKRLAEATGGGRVADCPAPLDFTLFKPRGHYDRWSLRGYFQAFSFYSQCGFALDGESLARALDVARLVDAPAKAELAKVRRLLELVAGPSDDPTLEEVLAAGGGATPGRVASLARGATFRLLGGAWTPDAELFGRTAGTPQRPFPSVLDVFAAMGSAEARAVLQPGPALQEALAAPLPEGAGLAGRWLHVLRTLVTRPAARQPAFAATDAWARRTLVAGAGSWAELKHDTLLYVKQPVVMAEGGDEAELPASKVGGYVDPRPDVYRELLALRGALAAAAGTPGGDELSAFLEFLVEVSELERAGKPFPKEADARLRTVGSELEHLSRTHGDRSPPQALVADVFTLATPDGPPRVLHAAIGDVDELWVVVPRAGKLVLMRGGAFSYYEFPAAPGVRLDDRRWRQALESGPPARPSWARPLPGARRPDAPLPRAD